MMSYETLTSFREQNPAWRLLAAQHGPLIASFLHAVFVAPGVREISESALAEKLEDRLYALREREGHDAYRDSAVAYLKEWAGASCGWLRRFYAPDGDEVHYDLTASTEKAISWLTSLATPSFVGTESRLSLLFELLEQIYQGSETDPKVRVQELMRKRDAIDAEIRRVQAGEFSLMDDVAIKERFLEFQRMSGALLSDFRQLVYNFLQLDRQARENIASWDGSKGALLDLVLSEYDAIQNSDQGRSFRAFCELLRSSSRQEELTRWLDRMLSLPAVQELNPDPRLRHVLYDWLGASGYAQDVMARLSGQLRRFLDDQALNENRQIQELMRSIESQALQLRGSEPAGRIMTLDAMKPAIWLPMERPLYAPKTTELKARVLPEDENAPAPDLSKLLRQREVDVHRLIQILRQALDSHNDITLGRLLQEYPLQQGLPELVAWLELAHGTRLRPEGIHVREDVSVQDEAHWTVASTQEADRIRSALMSRVIFTR